MTLKVRKRLRPAPGPPAPKPPVEDLAPPSRLARMLALAYRVERAIEDGEIQDYAAAARALGVTRARMSQIAALRWLAVQVQERILRGDLRRSERCLRVAVGVFHQGLSSDIIEK